MTKKIIAPFLAFTTAFISTAIVVSVPTEYAHASASNLAERTAERRAARSRGTPPVSNRILSPKSTTTQTKPTQNRRQLRINQRRSRSVSVPTKSTPTTSLSRLERRESRRSRRLAGKPVPVKQLLTDGVNMERAKQGVAPLRYHKNLEDSAQKHAFDMEIRDYFSHENPEGQRSGDRIKETGYGVINAQECRCSYKVYLGENIAKGQKTVEQVIREWMESESHREAMLSKDYQEIGVGITGDIWVLNFGSVDIEPMRK